MLDLETIQNHLVTHCESLGCFDNVVTTEPANAVAGGVTASIILTRIGPDRAISGLNITSAVVVFTVRIWRNKTVMPHYGIDLATMKAAEGLINSLHDDFTLGDDATCIKFLSGENFGALSGLVVLDEGVHRVIDVTIPIQVADVWPQIRK